MFLIVATTSYYMNTFTLHYITFKFISLKLFSNDEHFDKVGNRNFSAEIYIPDDLKERTRSS